MSSFKIDLLNISMNETHLPEVFDKLVAMNTDLRRKSNFSRKVKSSHPKVKS
jgi:hypothetical protein